MKKNLDSMNKGFTLIEIMVVFVIIAIAATFLGPKIMDLPEKARVRKAESDMRVIGTALQMYKLDNGFYPTTEQGLEALVVEPSTEPFPHSWKPNGYLQTDSEPKDSWGNFYIYRCPAEDGSDFEIISLGADGKEGGKGYDSDIRYKIKG